MVPEEQDEEQSVSQSLSNTARNLRQHIQEKARLIQSFTRRSELVIVSVDSIQAYKNVVVDETERIVVVRFHAKWCKSCQAAEPHFMKLASKYSMKGVKFVEVPLTHGTAYIQNALSVPSVPFAHIYYPGAGLVEELKLSKAHIPEFDAILNTYLQGFCDLESEGEIGAFQ